MGKANRKDAKAREIRITHNADKNISDILHYIGSVNNQPLNAEKVRKRIVNTITRIELTPNAFGECPELPTLSQMYRRATCLSWQIVYRIRPDEIIILGVIHKSQKSPTIKILRNIK